MTDIVIALSVVFITAGVLALVANQFEFSPIPFYIIAGLITGRFVAQPDIVELAQWGIAFLVFVFGISVDLEDIQSVLRDGEIAAFTQLFVVGTIAFGVGSGFGIYFGFDDPLRNAIYFAAAATLSSTIVGSGALEREIRNNLVHGRLASSIHFFDDVVAVGVLVVLSAPVLTDSQLVAANIGYGFLLLLAGILLYRYGFPLLVRAADGSDELVLMGSISILIAFIAGAEALGLSIVIGAFAAGIAVRDEGATLLGVRNGIESIKDFFVAIFFVTVGALVAIPTVGVLVLAGTLIVLIAVLSPLVHMLAFMHEGYDARTAFLASSSLNQLSEFSIVIALQALAMGTIAGGLFDAIILAAAVTMILTTVARRYKNAVYETVVSSFFSSRRTRQVDEHSQVDADLGDHIVVVGYGRQGRWLIDKLEDLDEPYVVVENDPVRRDDLQSECRNYVFGDATAAYPMECAQVADATLVVSTVDHSSVSESILDLETSADTVLRAETSHEARELLEAGATYVSVPDVLASDQLIENVERIVEDEREVTALRDDHRDLLDTLERHGFATQFESH